MATKKKAKTKRLNKSLYVYMAFVTMIVVHFFTKPFKRGLGALGKRLKNASKKNSLRAQLELGQQTYTPVSFLRHETKPPKKIKQHH